MEHKENSFKKYLMRIMGTRWDAQSHEDKYSTGIPDLSFGAANVGGWIELKHVKKFPAQQTTPINLKHFEREQVNWLKNRGSKCNACFVFVQVAETYFLYRWTAAASLRAGLDTRNMYQFAEKVWHKSIDPDELLAALIRGK